MTENEIQKLSREAWEYYIEQYIFNEVHRELIKRRMLDGVPYEQLAEEFSYSVTHTKHICSKCRKKLLQILS